MQTAEVEMDAELKRVVAYRFLNVTVVEVYTRGHGDYVLWASWLKETRPFTVHAEACKAARELFVAHLRSELSRSCRVLRGACEFLDLPFSSLTEEDTRLAPIDAGRFQIFPYTPL